MCATSGRVALLTGGLHCVPAPLHPQGRCASASLMAFATLDRGASTRERQALWGRPGSQPTHAQTTIQQGQNPSGRLWLASYAPLMAWEEEIDRLDVLPRIVRRALEEVEGCVQGGAYAMATVAARRGLEALCREQGAKSGTLEKRLIALKDVGKIDGRLAEWATHLRNIGNEGAHDLDFEPDREEALDSQALLTSMVRYVYIDQARYEDAKRRWEYRRLRPLDVTYLVSNYKNGCQRLAVLKPREAIDPTNDLGGPLIGEWVHHKAGYVSRSERSYADIQDDHWTSHRRRVDDWLQARSRRIGDWNRATFPDENTDCPDKRHDDEAPF